MRMRRLMACSGSPIPATTVSPSTVISCAIGSCRCCANAGRKRWAWRAARSCPRKPRSADLRRRAGARRRAQRDPQALQVTACCWRCLPPRRARVLRRWIAELGLPPLPNEGVAHIEPICGVPTATATRVLGSRPGCVVGATACMRIGNARDCRRSGSSHGMVGEPLTLPTGDQLLLHGAEAFAEPLRVHSRQGGERIGLPGAPSRHAIKHVLQEFGMPRRGYASGCRCS